MYKPSEKVLEKYADLLVNFALRDCKGIKKGDVVLLNVPECAKPMLLALRRAVWKGGGQTIVQYTPDDIAKEFYEKASKEQITFFPGKYLKGLVEEVDHSVSIIADSNPKELEGVNSKLIMERQRVFKQYMEWKDEKEDGGRFTWTLALYATEAMAKEAKMSLKEYWGEIINACYLNEKNPIKKWQEITKEIDRLKKKLNDLKIEKVHVEGKNIDLWVGLGKNRKWLGGSGRNIPSYEVFISPDKYKTDGSIKFNQPLYRYGNLIKDVELVFEKGRVVKAKASQGEKVLKDMIATSGADMIGEFSLTDSRTSRIDKFMAETLFDENRGGKFGNMHVALGNAYTDSYTGNPAKVTKKQWEKMGYNNSVVHTDIVNTEEKKVTAYLRSGKEKVIYDKGKFTI